MAVPIGGRSAGRRAGARLSLLLAVAATAAGALAPAPASAGKTELTRYSIVHGCFALRPASGSGLVAKSGGAYAASAPGLAQAEPFRMQATDLGRYLLYGTDRDFLSADGGAIVSAAEPSDGADWTVREADGGFTFVNGFVDRALAVGPNGDLVAGAPGSPAAFELVAASGCPKYPEIELNVKGTPRKGPTSYGEVSGFIEGHMHGMAFEFLGGRAHCGKPWHRFGAPYALRDCPDHEVGGGCGAVLDNVLYGNPARCHSPMGWPTFEGWPDYKSLTHEQSYWRWLERAWAGGLRLYVNLMVENRALCELYPLKQNSCNEMDSVLLQIKRIKEFQDYIDAQSGGPGKGFFRIVRSPFQARKVINRGKLAVVQGMEVSEPFGCKLQNGAPQCDEQDIDGWIDRLKALGLRQFEITNKFDNALTGVAGDSGSQGVIVNGGNFYTTGRFWDLEHCDDPENHDHEPTGVVVHNDDAVIANGFNAFLPPGAAPVYPAPPYCNTIGLSPLGEHAIRKLIREHLIFDPDHMSVLGRNQALNLVEAKDYSGIISSHSWSTPNALPRIYKLGGIVTPSSSEADGFIDEYLHLRVDYTGKQYFGVGYGADQNGFATQPGPRDPSIAPPVEYPFRSIDGSTRIFAQQSGTRTYDINTDGIAHYGLYPDWIEDLRLVGGKRIARDMARGAEAYLQMWERAEGIGEVRCDAWRQRFLTSKGLVDRVQLGDGPRQVLERAGQPVERTRTWRWCARSRPGGGQAKRPAKQVVAVFDEAPRVALIASTLRKHRADGIRPGMPARVLKRRAESAGAGIWVRSAGKGRDFVYGAKHGRVSFVALADRGVALKPSLRRAGLR
jgi:microsomal dipeptidase-like Zn-dependent dipeptidase